MRLRAAAPVLIAALAGWVAFACGPSGASPDGGPRPDGGGASDAGCPLPASCPAPERFAADAAIIAQLGADCFDCTDGGGEELCALQADQSFLCSCHAPCE